MDEPVNDWEFVCPHCGKEDGDTWELKLEQDEATETVCPHCGEPVYVICEVTYTYRASKVY